MMKKIIFIVFASLLILSSTPVFAQMPMTVPIAAPLSLEKIGVVAAAKGKVELTTPGQIGRIASSGQPVFMGDEVKTDAKGHLQILLLDQTVFTIGASSTIVIDEFVYDPKTNDGKIRASVTKGVFRYVSGKIAAKSPDNVSVKLPTATIGFRGTIVAGQVNQDGSSMAALLGPGANNDAGAKIGSFVMEGTGNNAGESQEVNRTGFGVQVGADGGVSGVFQLSETQIQNLTSGLSPSGDQDGNGGGDESGGGAGAGGQGGDTPSGPGGGGVAGGNDGAVPELDGPVSKISGEALVAAVQNVGDMASFSDLMNAADNATDQAAQDAATQSTVANDPAKPRITPTQLEDPVFIGRGGVFHYQHFAGDFSYVQGANVYPGTVKASIDINFVNPSVPGNIGGANGSIPSYVEILVPGAALQDRLNLASTNFSAGPGPATELWTGTGVNGGSFNVLVELQNVETDVVTKTAEQAKVTTVYTNSTNSGSGDMIAQIAPGATAIPPSV